MGKKKPFVDKKKSSTYHLVHRSQRDVAGDVLLLSEGDTAASSMILWPSSSPDSNLPSTNAHVLTTEKEASTMAAWRERLSKAGLLAEDPERYLKPITGTGTFLNSSGKVDDAFARNNPRSQQQSVEEGLLEVDRQFDSIPLTEDCMEEEIAAALFGDFDENEYEELNDEFVLDAAKEPEDGAEETFDYDEHIRKLMEKAKRDRLGGHDRPESHAWGKEDSAFFTGVKALHEQDDDEEDDSLDHEFGAMDETPGVVPALSPDEERALCERFEETLAEYDSDEIGDCPEEEIAGPRPMEGDNEVEGALEDFLTERKDDVFMHGSRHYLTGVKHGGSGFSALVGKQMVHAKNLNGDKFDDEPEKVDHVLAEARERLALPPEQPPPEEILIDGKSYFSERERNPYDCESVLSTYSNLDNNPVTVEGSRRRRRKNKKTLIQPVEEKPIYQIQLSSKTGLPLALPAREYADFDDTTISVNRGIARQKNETKEEKKARKADVKQERQMARIQKRATREVFKEEFEKRSTGLIVDDVAGKTVFRYS